MVFSLQSTMHQFTVPTHKKPLVKATGWKTKNTKSSCTKLVDTHEEGSSKPTAPGKKACIGHSPERAYNNTEDVEELVEDLGPDQPSQRSRKQYVSTSCLNKHSPLIIYFRHKTTTYWSSWVVKMTFSRQCMCWRHHLEMQPAHIAPQ